MARATDGRYQRYYLPTVPRAHYETLGLLRNPTARRIADAVRAEPGVAQDALRRKLRISSASAS